MWRTNRRQREWDQSTEEGLALAEEWRLLACRPRRWGAADLSVLMGLGWEGKGSLFDSLNFTYQWRSHLWGWGEDVGGSGKGVWDLRESGSGDGQNRWGLQTGQESARSSARTQLWAERHGCSLWWPHGQPGAWTLDLVHSHHAATPSSQISCHTCSF